MQDAGFVHIYIMVDGQLVGDAMQGLAQQAVIVQRTNEILHNAFLFFREVGHVHLLLNLIVEGFGLSIDYLFALILRRHAAMINRQVFIVAT